MFQKPPVEIPGRLLRVSVPISSTHFLYRRKESKQRQANVLLQTTQHESNLERTNAMKFTNKNNHARILQKESEARLRRFAALDETTLLTEFESARMGLSDEAAEEKLDEFGSNVITAGNKNTTLHRLRESTINPFNTVLLVIAAISVFTDVIASDAADWLTVIIIVSLVAISSAVAFIQSQKSSAAAATLSEMIENRTDVWRGGKLIDIPIDEVVPGDIIRLSAGDILPADVRFLTAKDAFIAQAALTGESAPVEKFANLRNESNSAPTDLSNIGFMGSNMVSGSALVVALATGDDTYFGAMAQSLSGDKAKNAFERGVDSVSRLLIRMMLVMVPVVLLINGFAKQDWPGALMFAISVAVGLTPEMLPVIMTSTLAWGAVAMSKHKVIVKTLGAIQTFGEMDVLCTDKTGTLTEDKIVLEKYLNLLGEDDSRILRHAYRNSYFQTGLKNLIDLAIINRARTNGMEEALSGQNRVDEIPFDFARRRMSVVLEDGQGKRQLITKGAVEEIMSICTMAELHGQAIPLDDETRRKALAVYEKYNADGLRMIAVAQKNNVPPEGAFSVADERDMVLLGFVGFLDPPKESAREAIAALRTHGVRTVVLTGDSEGVAAKVCAKVGVNTKRLLTGRNVEQMDDTALLEAVDTCDIFAKLSPAQKERVVRAFQTAGHTVGYMGDGINDAPPLHQADVGISVDSAVDIAKETADIILMEKDLMVLEQGVIRGRNTFGNIVKYIKMAASGNFGNMISVIFASIFLPFLPMLPIQILTQNLLCDFSQMGIPFDSVDKEYVKVPRKWETKSIASFMAFMGPLSSIFDILCFAIMWWAMKANSLELSRLFQCGWFIFGTLSQVLVIHMIRTAKLPFVQSRASKPVTLSTALIAIVAIVIGFTPLAVGLEMTALPPSFVPWLIALLAGYLILAQLVKKVYVKKYKEWL
ncbi:MAG: magnesium-translocating P-type ATPase [Oscillospiraceae bacterium]|jgi:Mg2+-importing ATPase|nr:magnesium-translocating P-type ATPase [Oscillospiraceae bacterium]